jgi:hypothetical protein
MRTHSIPITASFLATVIVTPSFAETEVVASKCLTIQPTGPRAGDAGSKYFNVEGKSNEKYASFGVLVFEIPKEIQGKQIKRLTLSLVQSIPKFAKDGRIEFFLAPDLGDEGELKFDPNASGGVGNQIRSLLPLGSGQFKKIETGKVDVFNLTVDDTVRERVARGGKSCLVIVPGDEAVAATYFGAAGDAKDKSPRLTLDLP